MKHLLLLITVSVLLYVGWQITPEQERNRALSVVARHGIRLAAIVFALLALAAAAVWLPASPFLPN